MLIVASVTAFIWVTSKFNCYLLYSPEYNALWISSMLAFQSHLKYNTSQHEIALLCQHQPLASTPSKFLTTSFLLNCFVKLKKKQKWLITCLIMSFAFAHNISGWSESCSVLHFSVKKITYFLTAKFLFPESLPLPLIYSYSLHD